MTLQDAMPREFSYENTDCKAFKFASVKVIKEHSVQDNAMWRQWPGHHKNVKFWVELENGYSVGFNENVSRGWSFPVIKTP